MTSTPDPASPGEPEAPAPAAPPASASPTKLFSPGQVAAGTFLGNAITGAVLMALNYWRLGERKEAWITIAAGLVVTGVVFAAAMALPQVVCNGMYIGQAVAARYIAKALQGAAFDNHIAHGGKKSSSWAVFGMGMVSLVLMICIVFAMYFKPEMLEDKIRVSPHETVSYEGDATKEDATKLGAALKEVGYFDGTNAASVEIRKDSDGTKSISFTVKDGIWNNEKDVQSFTEVGRELAPSVGGLPVHVRLCDDAWNVKKDVEVK